jgi:hypothetical protein
MQAIQLELDLGDSLSDGAAAGTPHPCTPAGITSDQNRVKLLDALYALDGRGRPDHPLKGTYTGLAEAFHLAIGRLVVDEALKSPDFTFQMLGGCGFPGA